MHPSATLESVIRASPDPMFTVDLEGRIQSWNPAAAEVFGRSEAEVVGEEVETIDRELEGCAPIEDYVDQVTTTESRPDVEARRRTENDNIVHLRLSVGPLRDADGAIDGAVIVAKDVTEQRAHRQRLTEKIEQFDAVLNDQMGEREQPSGASDRKERQPTTAPPLQEDEKRAQEGGSEADRRVSARTTDGETHTLRLFRRAVESSGHAIYFTDRAGTIEYVNPAFERTTGFSADEAVGRNPRILKSGEHGKEFYQELWQTVLDGEVWRSQIINERKSGERYAVDQTIAPVRDDAGTISHFVAVNADITTQLEQNRELVRKNELLENFAGIVSHDLRNPLNVAQGRVEMAREEHDSDDLDVAARSLDHMESLIEELLRLASEGESVLEFESVALDDVVEACWDRVDTKDASLVRKTDRTVMADRNRLEELLGNLFRNAVEHGGTDVTITVGELPEGFYVEDTGPGIPPEVREHAFEAGYTTEDEGTGFGLNIVKEIAEAHGWDISITDSADGGARFELTGVDAPTCETNTPGRIDSTILPE